MSDGGMMSNMSVMGRPIEDRMRPTEAEHQGGSHDPDCPDCRSYALGIELPPAVLSGTLTEISIGKPIRLISEFEVEPVKVEPPKSFPIMARDSKNNRIKAAIPWALAELMRQGAMDNHGQTIERLAERGGLTWKEAIHCLAKLRYGQLQCDDRQAQIMMAGAAHALDRVRGK